MLSKNTIKQINLLDQKKQRKQQNLFVVEGEKMVLELIESDLNTQEIFALPFFAEKYSSHLKKIKTTIIDEQELKKISQLKTPNYALALANIPDAPTQNELVKNKLYLALDNIQDPGNLGTIIRTANWFGVDTLFCSNDTVDAYNSKVVQATMGALFNTSIIYTPLADIFNRAKENSIPIYGTSLTGENIYNKALPESAIIVMGNESKGISADVYAFIDEKIKIPAYLEASGAHIESLNVAVAASIIMAEFRKSTSK